MQDHRTSLVLASLIFSWVAFASSGTLRPPVCCASGLCNHTVEESWPLREFWPTHGCIVLRRVCVESGYFVTYDRQYLLHSHNGQGLPILDLTDIKYHHRHVDINQPGHPERTVYGNVAPFPKDIIRLPSPMEYGRRVLFSKCTIPVVVFQHWHHNLAEFLTRTPSIISNMQQKGLFSRNFTLVVGSPMGIPLPPFVRVLLQPYSNLQVTSLADFSAPAPANTTSQSTHEGKHIRCFEQLVFCKYTYQNFPNLYNAGQEIYTAYKNGGMKPRSLFRSPPGSKLRVLFERRTGMAGTRQILNLDSIIKLCNDHAWDMVALGRRELGGVECRSTVFGHHVAQDVVTMQEEVDVYISIHGAGGAQAMFMKENSSYIELRPFEFGTKFNWLPKVWWPVICKQTKYKVFCWFMNLDDPQSWEPGPFEKHGVDSEANHHPHFRARDRNVRLKFEWLEFMLGKILRTGHDHVAYERQWNASQVAFTFAYDNITPTPHQPD